MDNIPSQAGPDAVAQDVRDDSRTSRPPEPTAPSVKVAPLALGRGGGMTAEQIGSISALHEVFGRNLARQLVTQLKTTVEVGLISAEQVSFGELAQHFAEQSYLGTIQAEPLDANILFELDTALAFPVIDLLLGGDGKGDPPERDFTEIEDLVLQSGLETICKELLAIWKEHVDLSFRLGSRQPRAKASKLVPAEDRFLTIGFELKLVERQGNLMLAFPASVTGALLRAFSGQVAITRHQPGPEYIVSRRRRVRNCTFEAEVRLPETPVSLQLLLQLEPGQVLRLGHPITEPALVMIGDQKLFRARPVRARNLRGALVDGELLTAKPAAKECHE